MILIACLICFTATAGVKFEDLGRGLTKFRLMFKFPISKIRLLVLQKDFEEKTSAKTEQNPLSDFLQVSL